MRSTRTRCFVIFGALIALLALAGFGIAVAGFVTPVS